MNNEILLGLTVLFGIIAVVISALYEPKKKKA